MFRPRTTLPGPGAAPNLIKELEPNAPDQVWASDVTYVSTLEGWLYLAVILDLFSRRVVGWKLGESLEAELVVAALRNALVLRQPDQGLYFHSDRGSQYSSEAVRKPLSVIGAKQSMSGVGNCYDNATVEVFFSTLKTECFPDNHLFDCLDLLGEKGRLIGPVLDVDARDARGNDRLEIFHDDSRLL
jgi:transposase InsO family protein